MGQTTFRVRGQTFRVHKSVLAVRSPVFGAEFFGPMKEATAQLLTIKGMFSSGELSMLESASTSSTPTPCQ